MQNPYSKTFLDVKFLFLNREITTANSGLATTNQPSFILAPQVAWKMAKNPFLHGA